MYTPNDSGIPALAKGSTQIWYMSPERWNLIDRTKVAAESLSQTHVHIANVVSKDLEEIFFNMQAENWSPNGEARELIGALGLVHTSMSVGDVVAVDSGEGYHNVFVVAPLGFEQIGAREIIC